VTLSLSWAASMRRRARRRPASAAPWPRCSASPASARCTACCRSATASCGRRWARRRAAPHKTAPAHTRCKLCTGLAVRQRRARRAACSAAWSTDSAPGGAGGGARRAAGAPGGGRGGAARARSRARRGRGAPRAHRRRHERPAAPHGGGRARCPARAHRRRRRARRRRGRRRGRRRYARRVAPSRPPCRPHALGSCCV